MLKKKTLEVEAKTKETNIKHLREKKEKALRSSPKREGIRMKKQRNKKSIQTNKK